MITRITTAVMILLIGSRKDKIFLYISFAAIFLASLFIYLPSLGLYFFQDDWFILNWAKTGSLLSFLSFREDIIAWRPLSVPIFFATLNKLFGLNYIAFHICAFLIFLLLLVMIYKLLNVLLKNSGISLVLTFLYAIWPINYISLSWLVATEYVIAPVFMTASFLSFAKYVQVRKKIYLAACYATFLAALMSHETALVLPALFVIWTAIYQRKVPIAAISPMLTISAAFMFIRFFVIPLPTTGAYAIQVSKAVFLNFIWYWLWAFNFPESFKSLIDPRVIGQSILVLKQFWWISLSSATVIFVFLFLMARSLKDDVRHYLFGFSWFTIMLLPVMFVPGHTFPIYLSFAGLGFLYMIGTSIKKAKFIFTVALTFFWTVSAIANFQFTRATHWVENEQSISRNYVVFTKSTIKNPPANSIFVFLPTYKNSQQKGELELAKDLDTLKLSLSDQNALQVIYDDPTIKSFYSVSSSQVEFTDNSVYYISPN